MNFTTTLDRQPGNALAANCIVLVHHCKMHMKETEMGWLRFRNYHLHIFNMMKLKQSPEKTTSWNPHKRFSGFENSLIHIDTHHPSWMSQEIII